MVLPEKPDNLAHYSVASFDYDLPENLVAQQPLPQRDQSKLLVLARKNGQMEDAVFRDLPELLSPGDLLVMNQTAVVPARFHARRQSGGRIEGLFLREVSTGLWMALLRNAQKCRVGQSLEIENANGARLEIVESLGQGEYKLKLDPPLPAMEVLSAAGQTPLPPYIRRPSARSAQNDLADRSRYQTVYASSPGAVAAPTAGLHFTPEILEHLTARGIETAMLTLHVGMGTFLPVKCDDLRSHKMHAEWYQLPASAAESINRARRDGRRVIAVGTTSVRVLETAARNCELAGRGGPDLLSPCEGWTDIFIYPPCHFLAVDALITNFHLPRSTLLMLVAAFCSPGDTDGRDIILQAYRHAVSGNYRFYSYGDAMLIR